MASGLNVVTTDGGGAIPYIMTNEVSGLIVDKDDHQALAAGAIRLLNDNEFALKLVRNAHESTKKFTWPYIREQWLDVYHELARAHGVLASAGAKGRVPVAKTDSVL
jgi:glycosyltransferase involved in cell wall biosynthesis